jgi:hypothetical protein
MAVRGRSSQALRVAAVAGALWGLGGYALLWGHTPVFVHRPFVESIPGTMLLFPVRVILWVIHGLERAAGAPFDFSDNHWWIGVAAAAAGAIILAGITWFVRWGARAVRARRSRGESVTEPAEGI